MGRARMQVLKGTLDMLILQVLSDEPKHGYSITRTIEDLTDEVLRVEEGSMYPALYRMEKRGLIVSTWKKSEKGRRARVYRITAAGRKRLATEADKWARFADAVFKVMPTGGAR